ncbi:SDR family oxidoreductase [Sulfurisphaera ohwakuensis]|uniref:3-oxoacyl-[acyl-carrier protein] reductase n=1 Tax=Sulfurisphaera ohwakuensis TaxID=69656 RepID=A0A650CH23_SULOH|nr:SDR family oxidoreductase [Sulfurisphaera ohwakuensis]MBB5252506.1 3-oxoacyl-[acyl-carrier protein] reductase [Sulfurisphaera ohwakuensis]QGR17048.1 SDR family oxidoreductase [Sulfurisphaera ohwakuensis]
MNVDINGKRVLITASTEGIGKGLARTLSREGCKVIITSRNEHKVKSTVEELKKYNPEVYGYVSDLTDYSNLEALVKFMLEKIGGIDVLIFNSGNPPSEPSYFDETSIEDWEYSVKLYLLSAIKLTKLVLPYMKSQRWGRILYLSSWTIKQPQRIFVLADVSRSSIVQLTKILSKELGSYNITVNTILMGSFETEGAKRSLKKLAEKQKIDFEELWKKEVIERSPLKRTGDIEKELGSLIAYLISDYASYITGSVIQIDGGTSDAI